MATSEIWIIVGVIALIAVGVVVWLAVLASALTIAFTGFVMRLPIFISLIMFVLFPPTLIVFLSGYAMIEFGFADKMLGDNQSKLKEK